jgi:hypothetical protein
VLESRDDVVRRLLVVLREEAAQERLAALASESRRAPSAERHVRGGWLEREAVQLLHRLGGITARPGRFAH